MTEPCYFQAAECYAEQVESIIDPIRTRLVYGKQHSIPDYPSLCQHRGTCAMDKKEFLLLLSQAVEEDNRIKASDLYASWQKRKKMDLLIVEK